MPGNPTDALRSPPFTSIHGRIEQQAAANPQAIATVFNEETLTYGELNAQANQLAHALRRLGIRPDSRVGLFMERSPLLVVAFLGVLKAGGCCVPLQPDYPAESTARLLANVRPALILTQSHLLSRLPPGNRPPLLELDRFDTSHELRHNPPARTRPDNLALILHTSGSTGRPKGVMRVHRGYVAVTQAASGKVPATPDRVSLLRAPISYNSFAGELLIPLLSGAKLVIAGPAAAADPDHLVALMRRHHVNFLALTPSLLRQLLALPEFARCQSLRLVYCSGEALPLPVQKKFLATLAAELHVVYGCTEAPGVASWQCRPDAERTWHPAGKPRHPRQAYVVDRNLNLAPVGEIGELLLSSPAMSAGYWQDPALTAARFLPNPFAGSGERLYRSGDLGRYREDGVIEYLGRADRQVQIRGMRVEPAAVEMALDGLAAVAKSAVQLAVTPAGETRLVAYLMPANTSQPGTAELRQALARSLPLHMVPAYYVWLERLPLTASDKVDYRALPAPDFSRHHLAEPFVPPRTPTEETIAAIWCDVLNLTAVGINDDFFALGGHSLLLFHTIVRIEKSLQLTLSQAVFFDPPTVAGIARAIEARPAPAATSTGRATSPATPD